jgi:acyl-CoA thioesterase
LELLEGERYLNLGTSLSSEVSFDPMVIIAVFGGLVVGGALFAILKNSGGKSTDDKYTKLDIG